MGVCDGCGYNLPHHGPGCSEATATRALCPTHAPAGQIGTGDDAKATCETCGAYGYHVKHYPA